MTSIINLEIIYQLYHSPLNIIWDGMCSVTNVPVFYNLPVHGEILGKNLNLKQSSGEYSGGDIAIEPIPR
jgi:hypothetical protein